MGGNRLIRERHEAYRTPIQTLSGVVREAVEQDIQSYEKIVRGYDKEVYAVATRAGALIGRIRCHGNAEEAEPVARALRKALDAWRQQWAA